MVHMAHYGHHRRAGFGGLGLGVFRLEYVDLVEGRFFHLVTEFRGHQGGGVEIQGLVHAGHNAHAHEFFYDVAGFYGQAVGQFGNGDHFIHLYAALDGLGNRDFRLGLDLFDSLAPAPDSLPVSFGVEVSPFNHVTAAGRFGALAVFAFKAAMALLLFAVPPADAVLVRRRRRGDRGPPQIKAGSGRSRPARFGF